MIRLLFSGLGGSLLGAPAGAWLAPVVRLHPVAGAIAGNYIGFSLGMAAVAALSAWRSRG